MHRSRIGGIMIDCRTTDPASAAEFWSAALGYPAKSRAPGSPYVNLDPPRRELYAVVQAVEHESRVHIDIETDDVEAEVARLQEIGAREIGRVKSWVVMEAPTGQRFCIVPVESDHFDATANHWE